MLRIIPKPGLRIRDPENKGKVLPPEGITRRRLNPFWIRRLNDSSIEVLTIPDAPPAPTPPRNNPCP